MAKRWQEVRAKAVGTGQVDEKRVAEHKRRVLAEVRAHRARRDSRSLRPQPDHGRGQARHLPVARVQDRAG